MLVSLGHICNDFYCREVLLGVLSICTVVSDSDHMWYTVQTLTDQTSQYSKCM